MDTALWVRSLGVGLPFALALSSGWGCYLGVTADASEAGDDEAEADGESGDTDGGEGGEGLMPSSIPDPLVARLTDRQYRFTVLDLFGEELTEQELDWLPRDVPIEGDYATSVEAQGFNAQYVLGYAYIARGLTARLDLEEVQERFADCVGVDQACLEAFVDGLGRRMHRRPLEASERAVYLELAAAIMDEPEAGDDDVRAGLIQAFLQAPQFLYRVEPETDGEPGELRRLDGFELASRLSYFLWQSTPDDALLDAAAGSGEDGAYDPELFTAEIERMIQDPKFARARTQFWGDYSLASTSSFGSTDPQLIEELRASLMATLDHISGVDGEPQPLTAVFDGQELLMTPAVAEMAGAESLGPGMQVYDVALAEERLGVVTHPAFLAAIGTTSFVGRGVFMSSRLLCQRTGPPPSGFSEQIENTAAATEEMTPREASEFRFGLDEICLSCHVQFEPISYGFERYDIQGRFALTDDEGRPLYSHGVLPEWSGRPEISFENAPDLLGQLAEQDSLYRCFVDNMSEFGTGHQARWAGDALPDALASFEAEGLTFEALVHAIAAGEQMTYIRNAEAP